MFNSETNYDNSRVPTSTGKPAKMIRVFPVRQKSVNLKIFAENPGILVGSEISQGKLDYELQNSCFIEYREKICVTIEYWEQKYSNILRPCRFSFLF